MFKRKKSESLCNTIVILFFLMKKRFGAFLFAILLAPTIAFAAESSVEEIAKSDSDNGVLTKNNVQVEDNKAVGNEAKFAEPYFANAKSEKSLVTKKTKYVLVKDLKAKNSEEVKSDDDQKSPATEVVVQQDISKEVLQNAVILNSETNVAKTDAQNAEALNEKNSDDKEVKVASNLKSRRITQGNYIGLDAIANVLSFHEVFSDEYLNRSNYAIKPDSTGAGNGFGLNYKYAFNHNNFFIAPGFFYEKLSTSARVSSASHPTPEVQKVRRLSISDRYGVTADVGYDVNDVFAPYFVLGYAMVNYRSLGGVGYFDSELQSAIKKSRDGSFLYGSGLKIKYNQELSFNIEFNIQKFVAKQNQIPDPDFSTFHSRYDAKIKSLKLGISYNF